MQEDDQLQDQVRSEPVQVARAWTGGPRPVGGSTRYPFGDAETRVVGYAEPDSAPRAPVGIVTLSDFFGILRRNLLTVIAGLLLGILAAAALFGATTASYQAQAAIKVAPVVVTGDTGAAKDISTITESRIVTSTAVAQLAAKRLNYIGGATTLLTHVTTTSPLNSQLIYINFSSGSAQRAADGANAFAAAYLDYRRSTAEDKLLKQAGALSKQIAGLRAQVDKIGAKGDGPQTKAALRTQIATLNTQLYSAQATVVVAGNVVGTADVPTSPSSPKKVLYGAGGVLFGLLLGVVAAIVRDRRDDRVNGVADFELATGTPVLAAIPWAEPNKGTSADRPSKPRFIAADRARQDGYRTLATKLRTTLVGPGSPAFLVLGAGARVSDGGVIALADSLTEQGVRVALVGARPSARLARRGLPPGPRHDPPASTAAGSDVEATLTDTDETQPVTAVAVADDLDVAEISGLRVVDLGEEDVLGNTITRRAADIAHALAWADIVLVDAVNIDRSSSALALGRLAPLALITGTDRHTTRTEAIRLHRELVQIGVQPVGAVLYQSGGRRRPGTTRAKS